MPTSTSVKIRKAVQLCAQIKMDLVQVNPQLDREELQRIEDFVMKHGSMSQLRKYLLNLDPADVERYFVELQDINQRTEALIKRSKVTN